MITIIGFMARPLGLKQYLWDKRTISCGLAVLQVTW